ncbi:MAG: flavin reductase family protein [Gammaproteobacteria bacterium]|nr:flavin reductase family protein [Gammaproteobacteria bacterium]
MSDVDPRLMRDTMGRFCTGVVLATGSLDGIPAGFAAQSFVSLSLEPALVALCPAKTSSSWPKLRAAGRFCINVLGADQKALCDAFARPRRRQVRGRPLACRRQRIADRRRRAGLPWTANCRPSTMPGISTIAVGRVLDLTVLDAERPPCCSSAAATAPSTTSIRPEGRRRSAR